MHKTTSLDNLNCDAYGNQSKHQIDSLKLYIV